MPPYPNGETEFRRCLDTALPTTLQKHAENMTIDLQCLNRLNGKDSAVLGKQVLCSTKKIFENIFVQSLIHCYAQAPFAKPFTPPSLITSAIKSKRSQGCGQF